MHPHLTTSFFTANRRAFRDQLQSSAPIVIAGNGLVERNGDSTFPFQQNSNFWYLTGLDDPDLTLVMTPSNEFIIVPGRDAVRQAFDGSIDTHALARRSGIHTVEGERSGWERLRHELNESGEVFTCGPARAYDRRHGAWANPATSRLHQKLKRNHPKLAFLPVEAHLARLRMRKQPAELDALRAAIDITGNTLLDVTAKLDTYSYEYEIEAAITYGFRHRGASGHSFSPIVANGAHATILHNVANDGMLDKSALTVLDIGAEVEHYAADITRTVIAGRPTKRQSAVHEAVKETQIHALSLLKPGVLLREYERDVTIHIGKHLQRLGLIHDLSYESIHHYYPHAASHFLGLDVHDVGDYSIPLEPNMVVTCEPGIYIPEEGIGVRIEDDVLITKAGHERLSATCPSSLGTVQ